jgi:16S rRNA (cytidine1402-2'-O)-methyltransferase
MPSKLFLIPNVISEEESSPAISGNLAGIVKNLRLFFVEEEKAARKLLRKIDSSFPLLECEFVLLNEHTDPKDISDYLKKIENKDAGMISESGCPCVADPGAELVLKAHKQGIEVVPLVGASSIILALMASGLTGQSFSFNGYLPKDKPSRLQKLKTLERRSALEHQTQIFMETPYHNQSLFEDILSVCGKNTLLCIACDLTGLQQSVNTMTVGEWKDKKVSLNKKPVLFLLEGKT